MRFGKSGSFNLTASQGSDSYVVLPTDFALFSRKGGGGAAILLTEILLVLAVDTLSSSPDSFCAQQIALVDSLRVLPDILHLPLAKTNKLEESVALGSLGCVSRVYFSAYPRCFSKSSKEIGLLGESNAILVLLERFSRTHMRATDGKTASVAICMLSSDTCCSLR